MRLCRFDADRLGIVEGAEVWDVTAAALELLPARRWPYPQGDALVANLDRLRAALADARARAPRLPLAEVQLRSPVANPSKIIAAPLNYRKHLEEAAASREIHHDAHVPDLEGHATPIDKLGLFIKATSSLAGPGDGVRLVFPDRRTDHELELVAVIGAEGSDIEPSTARQFIAGYAIGLDMTIRGPEDRSYRKSLNTYSVLGPWLVTAEEIADPGALGFALRVNDVVRQRGNTCDLLVGVDALVARASSSFRLYPGDLIYTGTAEGVGEVRRGDTMHCWIEAIGEMTVKVH